MTTDKLIAALSRLKVETGSLACLDCGHEHNCSTHGCAILRDAVETLQRADHTIQALQSCLDREVKRLKDENRSIRENSISNEAADLILTHKTERKKSDEQFTISK